MDTKTLEREAIIAEKAQVRRDLLQQVAELEGEDEREITFKDTSPRRRMTTIYDKKTGEPLRVPAGREQLDRILNKVDPDTGDYMFTGVQADAPEYKLGDVKCFLHEKSTYRTSGLLEEAGIGGFSCKSAHHPSQYAMEEIARTKHRKQWAALEAYLVRQRDDEYREQQRQQTAAMLRMAGPPKGKTCQSCGAEIIGKLADHIC